MGQTPRKAISYATFSAAYIATQCSVNVAIVQEVANSLRIESEHVVDNVHHYSSDDAARIRTAVAAL